MCSFKINYNNQSFSLKKQLLTQLKIFALKAPAEINTLVHLSQITVHQELYNSPAIIELLKEATHTLIQRIQEKRPGEPLQLHLGRHSSENPLSGLFLKAFGKLMEEYGDKIPIRVLHIHGTAEDNKALEYFLNRLHHCSTLYHLHLDLDENGSKRVFRFLSNPLTRCKGLEFLVFRHYKSSEKREALAYLTGAINSHKKLQNLAFYDLPLAPKVFSGAN